VAGASFSVGIAYTSRWFSKQTAGFAMGIFGAGNAGAALTKFVAPSIVVAWGWEMVPVIYAIAMTIVVVLFWMFTYSDESHKVESSVTMMDQLAMLKDPVVWKYCQYYSLVFGGFVALSLWMTKYYMNTYGHGIQEAALLAAIFVLPSGIIRALGGWLSDKFGAHQVTYWVMWTSLICLFFMSYPHTELLITTYQGEKIHMSVGINEYIFTALLFVVGIAWGFGKASVFKYLSDEYPDRIGVMSGVVGLAGGMGGFILPIMFGFLLDRTGIATTAFMLLFGVTLVSIMWMQLSGERDRDRAKKKQFEALDTLE
jgi:NNP family nitrate/nitrite transporter-like MFS transporter